MSKSGWDELEPTFRSVASRLSGGRDVTYEIISFDVSGEMAWTAGVARFTVSMDGGPLTPTAIRLAPPLVISAAELCGFLDALPAILETARAAQDGRPS